MDLLVPLKQRVSERFPWLFSELGFKAIDDDHRPESFGNSFVTLESPALRVRFVRDRGQEWVDIGLHAEPKQWWPLTLVLEAVRGEMAVPSLELDVVGQQLRDNFAGLVEAMGPKLLATKQELQRRAGERMQKMATPGNETK